jgi:hypothetical protein
VQPNLLILKMRLTSTLKTSSKESGAIGAAQIARDVYNGKKEILGILVDY